MKFTTYLSGEIHSTWRQELQNGCTEKNLDIQFLSPVTQHEASDDCGAKILGREANTFWHDHKAAKINALRTRTFIKKSDIVIVRFGDKYKQWNAAFEAGYAAAMDKPLIVLHDPELSHALKEIDATALAVAQTTEQVINILDYVLANPDIS